MSAISDPHAQGAMADGQARRHVEAIVRRAGTSFFWAMRWLPRDRREAIFAVYAFCREVDDIADGDAPLPDKQMALNTWRTEIARIYDDHRADSLIGQALLQPVRQFGLTREAFLAVIDGMEMDGAAIVAPSQAELRLYCARVAGAVGHLCVRIFGETGDAGRRTADQLGLALQLTNILRDIEEDAERGRLYLPRELLAAAGIATDDPQAALAHPAIGQVCDTVAAQAQQAFEAAAEAIAACNPQAHMRPAIIMMMVYKKTLQRLLASGWRHLGPKATARPPQMSKAEKLAIALRHGLF
ncbi:MAG: hypothetical protein Tsb0016_17040 [Sphingomonadales bacterium]